MGDYWNEDDLINDQFDNDEEPPEDYEMEIGGPPEPDEEEGVATNNAIGVNLIGGVSGGGADAVGLKGPSAFETNDVRAANAKDDDTTTDTDGIPKQISTSTTAPETLPTSYRTNSTPDIYGFERYTGISGWRSGFINPSSSSTTTGIPIFNLPSHNFRPPHRPPQLLLVHIPPHNIHHPLLCLHMHQLNQCRIPICHSQCIRHHG
mmetsp:Transcript_20136/g.43385  ORF Transcript_20136/g.43385 Transcript_20136/m.43385 type:complete len:206 (+) Transcript_20136:96-713(+)